MPDPKTTRTRTLTRIVPDAGTYDAGFVVAKLAASYHHPNRAAYFSLTGEEWKSERHHRLNLERSGWLSSGAMGEQLLAHWPGLADFEQMHLADVDTGEPMHAIANAWYFLSDYDGRGVNATPGTTWAALSPVERAASVLRVPVEDVPSIGLGKQRWKGACERFRVQWAQEARDALLRFFDYAEADALLCAVRAADEAREVPDLATFRAYAIGPQPPQGWADAAEFADACHGLAIRRGSIEGALAALYTDADVVDDDATTTMKEAPADA